MQVLLDLRILYADVRDQCALRVRVLDVEIAAFRRSRFSSQLVLRPGLVRVGELRIVGLGKAASITPAVPVWSL